MDRRDGTATNPSPKTTAVRSFLAAYIAFVVLLSIAAVLLYRSTLHDLRRLQPGYPDLIVLSVATPPAPFRIAHSSFPVILIMGSIAVAVAAFRRSRAPRASTAHLAIFVVHPVLMGILLLVFLWAAVWCSRVAMST